MLNALSKTIWLKITFSLLNFFLLASAFHVFPVPFPLSRHSRKKKKFITDGKNGEGKKEGREKKTATRKIFRKTGKKITKKKKKKEKEKKSRLKSLERLIPPFFFFICLSLSASRVFSSSFSFFLFKLNYYKNLSRMKWWKDLKFNNFVREISRVKGERWKGKEKRREKTGSREVGRGMGEGGWWWSRKRWKGIQIFRVLRLNPFKFPNPEFAFTKHLCLLNFITKKYRFCKKIMGDAGRDETRKAFENPKKKLN